MPGRHALPAAVLLLLAKPWVAWAQGGVGLPVLHITPPSPGEILEWSGGAPVELRWQDEDPDDDANLVLSRQADLDDPLTLEALRSGASDDSDPATNGPVFIGVDAGGGPLPFVALVHMGINQRDPMTMAISGTLVDFANGVGTQFDLGAGRPHQRERE